MNISKNTFHLPFSINVNHSLIHHFFVLRRDGPRTYTRHWSAFWPDHYTCCKAKEGQLVRSTTPES